MSDEAGDLNAGETVQLKSGGPVMTVEAIYNAKDGGARKVKVIWWSNDKLQREDLYAWTLKRATPAD